MDVIPFRSYRYNRAVVTDAGRCIAPPYDVIDADQQQRLHEQSPYNIVRVTRGMASPDDNGENNVYRRAAATLAAFVGDGVLTKDQHESVYVYAQDFQLGGKSYRRRGFVALGKLENYGGAVRPHEQTLTGPKADRLNLMRATRCQVGQIFMLYSEPTGIIDDVLARGCKGEQLIQHADEDKVVHRLFALTDSTDIATVCQTMAEQNVFIADGHHRYETALNYYDETQNPAAAYRMMTFVNTHNKGLVILPTHRLVKNLAQFDASALLNRLQEYCDVARLAFGDVVEKQAQRKMMQEALALEFDNGAHAFGMYFADGAFYVATLADVEVMNVLAGDHGEAWQRLDVAILHKLVLEKLLGIDETALTAQTNVEYIKDFGDATSKAIDKIDDGEAQGLFLLNSTRIEAVAAVAEAGEKMPQKSTFFYPKFFSGLVMNILD